MKTSIVMCYALYKTAVAVLQSARHSQRCTGQFTGQAMPKITQVTPFVQTHNLPDSRGFFEATLGFECTFAAENYAYLRREFHAKDPDNCLLFFGEYSKA
jgi:hypothetical protein